MEVITLITTLERQVGGRGGSNHISHNPRAPSGGYEVRSNHTSHNPRAPIALIDRPFMNYDPLLTSHVCNHFSGRYYVFSSPKIMEIVLFSALLAPFPMCFRCWQQAVLYQLVT